MNHYKNELNIIICLDKNKLLVSGYKFYPYDFFIQTKKEKLAKSNKDRKYPFEFEEALPVNIINLDNYIISVDFLNGSLYESYKSVNILKKKNIPIYEDSRRLL